MSVEQKYTSILTALACRNDNAHVADGFGGDTNQFLALLALIPSFVNDIEGLCQIDGSTLKLNQSKFDSLSKKDIRLFFNSFFTKELINELVSPELFNYIDLKSTSLEVKDFKSDSQRKIYEAMKLATSFKELVIKEIPTSGINNSLSQDLRDVVFKLQQLEPYYLLFSIRRCVGIEIIVSYNLDEYFSDLLNNLNSIVDYDSK